MVKIAHIADVHLGTRCTSLGDKAPEREKDFLLSFERAVDFCCAPENRIDALIIAGDLFDTFDPPSNLVGVVQKNISKLNQEGILVIAVPGTHDAYGYKNSIYRKDQLHGIHVLSSPVLDQPLVQEFTGKKVFFYGTAYMPGVSKNPFESFTPVPEDGIHIGIIHGSVGAPPHWEKRAQDLHITPEDIARSNLDYLALGHFHTFQKMQYGKTVAVYPGSLEGRTFSECGPRYMVVVDFTGRTPEVEKVAVNSRTIELIHLNLDDYPCQSLEEVLTLIKREYKDFESIVNLTITGSSQIPLDGSYLEEALSDSFFYITVKDHTSLVESHTVQSWVKEKTIRGMFVSKLLQEISRAEGEEKEILEEALKIGITNFQEVPL